MTDEQLLDQFAAALIADAEMPPLVTGLSRAVRLARTWSRVLGPPATVVSVLDRAAHLWTAVREKHHPCQT